MVALVIGAALAGYGILTGQLANHAQGQSQTVAGENVGDATSASTNKNVGGVVVAVPMAAVVKIDPAAYAKGNPQSYRPIGPATISLEVFTAYLREMGSPALAEVEAMYRACIEEGGDPAVALAFFEHESSGGRAGVAVLTHSIGNIRCTAGYSCTGTQGNGSFRSYENWAAGVRDWVRLLQSYKSGGWKATTLEEIIPHYAPQSDHNNEAAYIAGVKATVDKLRLRERGQP